MGAALGAALLSAGCGADRSAGPRGSPEQVVRAAPDRTFSAASAAVEAAAPDASSAGRIHFDRPPGTSAAPVADLEVTGRGSAKGYVELAHPLAMVDLVRGAVAVVSYGGVAVRGVSTFRYETVINVERALRATPAGRRAEVEAVAERLDAAAFYADVWIDKDGRVRRIQVPVDKTTVRPAARDRRAPRLLTVDLFDFSG